MNSPTNTNQASELFELCKDVYERFPEWVGVDYFFHTYELYGSERTGVMTRYDHNFPLSIEHMGLVPIYTSDYLLEKLPAHFYGGTIAMSAETDEGPTRYSFFYEDNYETARVVHCKNVRLQGWDDTPLKALLKLTIALSEAGELK